MRILLTGANGFAGSYIAAKLAGGDHELICLVRPGSRSRLLPLKDRLRIVELDMNDDTALRNAMARHQPDGVCHAAWHGVAGSLRNDVSQHANVVLSKKLAEAAAAHGVQVLLGLGSQAEYGPLNRIAHEHDPCRPSTRYGEAKCKAHDVMAAAAAAAGIRFAWMRIFSLYGPGDNPDWLLPSTICALLRGECPALTRAEQQWDFLHVDDAAQAIVAVMTTPSAMGPFNLGSGNAPTLRRTLETLRDMIDPALPLGFGELPYRPDQVMHLQADITRLTEATDWRPQIRLEDGLAQTVAWHRNSEP